MKYTLFTFFLLLATNHLQAQTNEQYSFKIEGIYGNIIPTDQHVKPLINKPITGAELSVEFQTMGNKPWQQFNGFPIIGLGSVWLDLGNQRLLGNAFALYPYINYPLIRSKYFRLGLKAGIGMSYLTKSYQNTRTNLNPQGNILPFDSVNSAIGTGLNVYISGGGSLEIPITKGFSLIAEYTWNHVSDGSTVVPNSGLNLLDGFVGIRYFPNYRKFNSPTRKELIEIPRKYSLEIAASGGYRQLFYLDNRTYPIGSLSVSAHRTLTNYYKMGLGIDAFYDGVYDGTSLYKRTYLTTDELKNKLRAGVSWQHELILGRLTAGVSLGLYLYDPLKNLEPVNKTTGELINPNQNKPLIYSYNILSEDGWSYTIGTLKYTLSNHLFMKVGLKTHLEKAEFIAWGLGYRL